MSISSKKYGQYFFDCDGVILDSNHIKSEAFFNAAKFFSPDLAPAFLRYHQENGGISRFEKFRYFFSTMMKLSSFDQELEKGLILFKEECVKGLSGCQVVTGVKDFLESLPKGSDVFVVSGGLESEVKDALFQKGLDKYFKEICGSPKTKYEIMSRLRQASSAALFFGDSKLDYEVAMHFNCDFVFIYGQTEFKEYQVFFQDKSIQQAKDFLSL